MHHTRATKTNSAVNLSRKPGLDLCCDLLQHLQGVPRTCSFYIITQIVFDMKYNQIQFPYYFGWQFLLNFVSFVQHVTAVSCISMS